MVNLLVLWVVDVVWFVVGVPGRLGIVVTCARCCLIGFEFVVCGWVLDVVGLCWDGSVWLLLVVFVGLLVCRVFGCSCALVLSAACGLFTGLVLGCLCFMFVGV